MAINFKHIPELCILMDRMEDLLISENRSEYPEVNEIADYILKNNGKRLRPLLLLTFAQMLGFQDNHLHLACAVEQIHTATLIHDDVIDASDLRRGRASVNSAYGVPTSILFGDYLYTKAFKLLIKYGNNLITNELLKTVSLMSEGEIKQMMESHDPDLTEENYFHVIRGKTSELFSLACKMAALLNFELEDKRTKSCEDFGFHLGNAFQITDDVMDYEATSTSMGKSPGDDFAEGKITLPMIHLLKHTCVPDREKVLQLLQLKTPDNSEKRKQAFPEILQLLKKYKSFDYCRSLADQEIELAQKSLKTFEDCVYTRLLSDILEHLVNRHT